MALFIITEDCVASEVWSEIIDKFAIYSDGMKLDSGITIGEMRNRHAKFNAETVRAEDIRFIMGRKDYPVLVCDECRKGVPKALKIAMENEVIVCNDCLEKSIKEMEDF